MRVILNAFRRSLCLTSSASFYSNGCPRLWLQTSINTRRYHSTPLFFRLLESNGNNNKKIILHRSLLLIGLVIVVIPAKRALESFNSNRGDIFSQRSALSWLFGKVYADQANDGLWSTLPYRTSEMLYNCPTTISNVQEPEPPSLIREVWLIVKHDWHLLLAVVITAVAGALANIWLPRITGQLVIAISKTIARKATELTENNTAIPEIANNARTLSASAYATSLTMLNTLLSAWHAVKDILTASPELNLPALRLLGLFGIKGLLTFSHISMITILGESVALRLRHRLFESLILQDVAFFDAHKSGELVGRISSDVQEFKHTFKQSVTQGIKCVTEIIGSVSHLIYLSPSLTSTLALTMPLLYVMGNVYGSYLRKLSSMNKSAESEANGIAGEALSNIRTVKAYAAEDREVQIYDYSSTKAGRSSIHLGVHIGLFQALTTTSIGSMILVVLYYGGSLVSQNKMEPGDLMTYLLSTQAAQKNFATVGILIGQLIKTVAACERVFEYIHLEPSIPTRGGIMPSFMAGNIKFTNVRFAYPGRSEQIVLDRFNLTLPAGTVVALCGSSGSGKSTVATLIERFYDIDGGIITIDGHDLKQLDPSWLRTNIGYIPQQPTLFSSSIADNIRYGKPDATFEEVEQAARLANAHEFIEDFPEGYHTIVGERGLALSGGQRQRIAIAAAILKNPKILILDEATSALDNQSERLVQEALDRLMAGRSVLVIAHRLSTIANADMIVVMGQIQHYSNELGEQGKGRVLEIGTHDELFQKRGVYYQLYTAGGGVGLTSI